MNTVSENRWHTLPLAEQMANIGSEVGRATKWQNKGRIRTVPVLMARLNELWS